MININTEAICQMRTLPENPPLLVLVESVKRRTEDIEPLLARRILNKIGIRRRKVRKEGKNDKVKHITCDIG